MIRENSVGWTEPWFGSRVTNLPGFRPLSQPFLGQDLDRPLLQFVAGVSVTLGHNDAVMAEKGPHGFDINPALDESRGERVPKVMEAYIVS